tara:strand:- start:414 stop:857 length:444 start_codon:yes stop_codon:yes gene_type:complete
MIIEQIILASDFLNGIIDRGEIIPIFGIMVAIIVPFGAFVFAYHEQKNKYDTIIEISKNLDDPSQVEELIKIFETRKKEPIDYRRSGIITLFVGAGLYMIGFIVFGKLLEGVGVLVGLIGVGQIFAGYLYPNTGKELTNAVEKYEKK